MTDTQPTAELKKATARGGYYVHLSACDTPRLMETYREAYMIAFRATRSIYAIKYNGRQAKRPPGVHWDPVVVFGTEGDR